MEEQKVASKSTATFSNSVNEAGGMAANGPSRPNSQVNTPDGTLLASNSQTEEVLKFRELFSLTSQGTVTMSGTVVSESTGPPVTTGSRDASTLKGFPSSVSSVAASNDSSLTSMISAKASSNHANLPSLMCNKVASLPSGTTPSLAPNLDVDDGKSPSISANAVGTLDTSLALLGVSNFPNFPSSPVASAYVADTKGLDSHSVLPESSTEDDMKDVEIDQTPESKRLWRTTAISVQTSGQKDERVLTNVESYPYMMLRRLQNYLTTPVSEEKDLNFELHQPFDWSILFDRPVHQDRLSSVVLALGILADKKPLKLHSSHHSANKKIYSCQHCFRFCLVFTCSKPQSGKGIDLNQFFLESPENADPTKEVDVTHLEHAPLCQDSSKLNIPIWDVPLACDYIRKMEFEPTGESRTVNPNMLQAVIEATGITIGKAYSTVNAGLHRMRTRYRREALDSYSVLPSYLRKYTRDNPTAFAVLQNDSDDSFFRCAVGIPNMALIFRHLCLPYIQIDGAHVKTELYDGVVLVVVAKLGDGSCILLSIAYVPSETKVHLVWYLLALYYSGIPIETIPIFSDRGNLIAATKALHKHFKITLSIKFCLEHIFRNIVHKFNLEKEQGLQRVIRARLHVLQSAETFEDFRYECEKTCELQDTKDPALGAKTIDYLLRIHPIHWTVFGNRPSLGGEDVWLRGYQYLILNVRHKLGDCSQAAKSKLADFVDHSLPRGKMLPLFHVSRNNQAESSANLLNKSGIRHCIPAVGIDRFISLTAIKQMKHYKEMVQRSVSNEQFMLPLGLKWWEKSLSISMQNCRSIPVTSFYKDEYAEMQVECRVSGGRKKMEKVTISLEGCTCTCCDWEMRRSLCPDIKVCLAELPLIRKPMHQRLVQVGQGLRNHPMFGDGELGCMHAFGASLMHPSVQTNRCLEVLQYMTTPLLSAFEVGGQVHICDLTQPPQVYRSKYDRKKNGKRFKSKGESGKSTKSTARLPTPGTPPRSPQAQRLTSQSYLVSRSKPNKEHTQSMQALVVEEFFDPCSQKYITDAVAKARVLSRLPGIRGAAFCLRHCGCCGDLNHTVRVCPEYMNGFRPHKPAKYLIPGAVIVCFLPPGWSARDALESLLNACATDRYDDAPMRCDGPVDYVSFMEQCCEEDTISVLDDINVVRGMASLPSHAAQAVTGDTGTRRGRVASKECVREKMVEIPVNRNIPPLKRGRDNSGETTTTATLKKSKHQHEGTFGVRDATSAVIAKGVFPPSSALVKPGPSSRSTNYRRRQLPTKSSNKKDDGSCTLASSTVQQSQNVKAKLQLMSSHQAAEISSCRTNLFAIDEATSGYFDSVMSSDSEDETPLSNLRMQKEGTPTQVESPGINGLDSSDSEPSYDSPIEDEDDKDTDDADGSVAGESQKTSPHAVVHEDKQEDDNEQKGNGIPTPPPPLKLRRSSPRRTKSSCTPESRRVIAQTPEKK